MCWTRAAGFHLLLAIAFSVSGATFEVNTYRDTHDANLSDPRCRDASGLCSLRAAVEQSNASVGRDDIELPVGLFHLVLDDPALLRVEDELMIRGSGINTTVIDGGGTHQVFRVTSEGDLRLEDLGIRNGSAFEGGAFFVAGELYLLRVRVAANVAVIGGAMAITPTAQAIIVRSVISDNSARPNPSGDDESGGWGGGISNSGRLTLIQSLVARNSTPLALPTQGQGGGIYNAGDLVLYNTVLSSNVADRGSALFNNGVGFTDVRFVTIAANVGPALFVDRGLVGLTATVLGNNVGDNCRGSVESLNGNLSDDVSCALDSTLDQNGVDVGLGPLTTDVVSFPGGPASAHPLLSGSPAIDLVPGEACADSTELGYDIVGQARPTDGDYDGVFGCDAGAYERPPDPPLVDLAGERFRVRVQWRNFEGGTGPGRLVAATPDSADFWFFSDDNIEITIKVLDACSFSGHYWVFFAAATNVGYTVTVEDLETSRVKTYENPLGTLSPAVGDTEAFPCDG